MTMTSEEQINHTLIHIDVAVMQYIHLEGLMKLSVPEERSDRIHQALRLKTALRVYTIQIEYIFQCLKTLGISFYYKPDSETLQEAKLYASRLYRHVRGLRLKIQEAQVILTQLTDINKSGD